MSRRIVLIADPLDRQYAGIKSYVKGFVDALDQWDTENEYFLVRSSRTGRYDHIREIPIPWKNWPGYRGFRYLLEIPRKIATIRPDIVIEMAHFGPFNLAPSIHRFTFIHDLSPILFPQWHPWLSSTIQKWFLPGTLERADHILTNSRFTANEIQRIFPRTSSKISFLHPDVPSCFHPVQAPETLIRYNLNDPFFLYLGTLEPRKNLQLLVKAFEQLKANGNIPHKLVLVGKKGWKTRELMEIIQQSPFHSEIIQPGYLPKEDLPALLSATTAFIYPSHYEGFGLPVLEAMRCGAPIIVANNSVLPEVVQDAGLFFSPEDVGSLVEKMNQILTTSPESAKRREMSIRQSKRFSWESTIQKFKGIIGSNFGTIDLESKG